METWKSQKQVENEKAEYINSLEKTLEKCLNIWGRGYEPKQGVQDTIGSLLYLECKKVLKQNK